VPLIRVLALALVVAAALVGRPALAATPSQELGAARTSFRAGDFPGAIATLSTLLYPQARLSDPAELAEAHLLLGVAYFEIGRREGAARELESALFLDDSLTIEPGLFSDEAVAFFQSRRRDVERRAAEAEERKRLARDRDRLRQLLKNVVVVEKRSYYLNFIPFGTGQFQNGDRKKGVFFAVAGAALGATSVGLYSYQVLSYGFRGKVPREEVDQVRTIQVIQVASGALCLGVMGWGIIDSLANYEHVYKRELDPSTREFLEDDLKDEEHKGGGATPPASSSLRVTPTLGPGYAGAGLSWEF
jgi:tetratricopeptide (TPR) repeat protein